MDGADMARAGAPNHGGWGWTPPLAWVALTMLLSVRGLYAMVPVAWDGSLPHAVTAYLQAGIAVAVVNLLWGGWILIAARSRSPALRRGFLAWQAFNLVAVAASVGYTTLVGDFVATASGMVVPALEFAVGIALTVHALRLPDATAPDTTAPEAGAVRPPAEGPAAPAPRRVLHGLLGGIAGAVLGGVAGFPFGALLADFLDVSCFEGGCGYFAAAIGLMLVVAGLVAGIVFGVIRSGRRHGRTAG